MKHFLLKAIFIFGASLVFADDNMTLSTSLEAVASLYAQIAAIFTGAAYVAGLMLFVGAIFKFRQHREAPQQVPIGQPLTLFGLSVLAVFLPGFLDLTGAFFNNKSAGATGDISALPGGDSSGGGSDSSSQ